MSNDVTVPPPRDLTHVPRADLVAGAAVLPLVPRSMDEVLQYAEIVLRANAVPEALCKEGGRQLPPNEIIARVVTVIASGSEVGMGPMASMANIALINRRRSIWGQAAVALIQSKGLLEEYKVERIGTQPSASDPTIKFADDFGIRVTLKRRGQATPYVGEFTVGKAKRAHLWMNTSKRPWVEHPERQLQWRAFHIAANDGFADCLFGLTIREIAEDLPPEGPPPKVDTSSLDDAPALAPPGAEMPALAPPAEAPIPTTYGGPGHSAPETIISIQSRTHDADVTGTVVTDPGDYEHIAIPDKPAQHDGDGKQYLDSPAGPADTAPPEVARPPLAGPAQPEPDPALIAPEPTPEEIATWTDWGTKMTMNIATCRDLVRLAKLESHFQVQARDYLAVLGTEKRLDMENLIAARRMELASEKRP